jgi:glycyl-tRNA synthetase
LAGDPAFLRVCEAMQRVRRIVPAGTAPEYDAGALAEPAELRLHELAAEVAKATEGVFDLRRFTQATDELSLCVAEFFEKVFVMVEDPRLRAARLGLLASVAAVGAHVLSWEQLQA